MSSNGTARGSGGGAGGPGGPQSAFGVSDDVLVYWFDVSLLFVLAAFFLAAIPRAIGRFNNSSEWGRGLILRGGTPPDPMTMIQRMPREDKLNRINTVNSYVEGGSSQDSHAPLTRFAHARTGSLPSGSGGGAPPKHIRSLTTVLHPVSKIFTLPVEPSKSFGKYLIGIIYVAVIVFLALNGNNPISGPTRLGYIATSQLPVVIALGTKNNVIGMLLGIGYEKLNFLHRLVGFVTLFLAKMHAIAYIFTFVITKEYEAFQSPVVKYGLMALYGVTILWLGTIGPIRKHAYALFLVMHISGSVLFFVGLWFHQPAAMKYILLSGGIYGFDHLFRIVKTRVATARLTAVPELGLTRVEVPSVGAGWRAGQHVRLRALSSSMGVLGWTTAHPFTIASASESPDGKGMVLLCKKAGNWTKKLYTIASDAAATGFERGNVLPSRDIKVVVEGPYGGTGNMVLSSYSSVLLVAGGSGITFALSAVEELIQDLQAGRSSVKFIKFVWSIQDRNSLGPMMPTFSSLLRDVTIVPGVVVRIIVHYTRAEKQPTDGGKSNALLDTHLATLAPNLTLQPSRPPLQRIMDSIARMTASISNARGLAVGVCGPASLTHETAKAVRAVDDDVRKECGGIELHEEVFGW